MSEANVTRGVTLPAARWMAPRGGRWQDGRCWDAGRPPLPDERACFDRPVAGVVNIDERVAVARVEVELGNPGAAVTLGGPGPLALTGADRLLGKPVALQVADGTLHLAAPLRVEVAAPRFGAHPGGTLVVATPHVRAVACDLKLMVSQTGVLALRTDRWEPGFDLDVATSRTLGLGPHVIDFGAERGPEPRLLAFRSFKEHDGDELLIRGFRPGDQLRFGEDPHESTDPGKDLRLDAVRFAGAGHAGAARLERRGRFFYLLPEDRRYAAPASASTEERPATRPVTAVQTASQEPIAQTARSGDAVSLPDGRLLAAVAADRPPLSISVSDGRRWSRPAALPLPHGAIGATAPSLLRLPSGAILLVCQALLASDAATVEVAACPDPTRAGTAAAWSPPRMVPDLNPNLRLANGRLAQARDALLLPFTLGSEAGLLTSTDEGATWQRLGPLLPGPGAGLRYPAVAEVGRGKLLLLAATSTHRIYRSESADGGSTWSTPTEVTTLIAPESPLALTLIPGAGLLVAWNHHSRRGDGRDRTRLSVATSADGLRWDRPRLLTPDPSLLATCPSIAPIDNEPGRFVATYVRLTDPDSGTGVLQSVELTIP